MDDPFDKFPELLAMSDIVDSLIDLKCNGGKARLYHDSKIGLKKCWVMISKTYEFQRWLLALKSRD